MKRFLISFIMAACIVGSLSARETLDSISYAMGDYYTRQIFEEYTDLQSQNKYEEYIRGLENLYTFMQDSAIAKCYTSGIEIGTFVMMMLYNEQPNKNQLFNQICIIDGVKKVISGDVLLPQDTIGARQLLMLQFSNEGETQLSDEETCRMNTAFGVMIARYPDRIGLIDLELSGPDSLAYRHAFASTILDALLAPWSSNIRNAYSIGRDYALFMFNTDKFTWGIDREVDYGVLIEGARSALGLSERKMTVEEVDDYMTNHIFNQSATDDAYDGINWEEIPDDMIEELNGIISDEEYNQIKELKKNKKSSD